MKLSITVPEFKKWKKEGRKITMLTCYDFSFAQILNNSSIDTLLIGDSSAMVMHGSGSTIHSTLEQIESHVASVAKGAPSKFIVADMPFLSVRKGFEHAVEGAGRLLKAGAHAVKIEGIRGNETIVRHLVESGIPVIGHLGLTPQFVNAFGGMKLQAKTQEEQDALLMDSKKFEDAGVFALVLECVPSSIAKTITEKVDISTIGIGAGIDVDGQVLVLQDLLGFNDHFKPRFLRRYFNGNEVFLSAFNQYAEDVRSKEFPNKEESYEGY